MLILTLIAGLDAQAAGHLSEFAAGRAFYAEGEFKKAVPHFQLSLKQDPNDAESSYWLGMSYQGLADAATPFGARYNSKARIYLTGAVELAPGRTDYRRALFDFLVDSADSSRGALPQAAGILQMVPEDDPEYTYMYRRLAHESKVNSSAEVRLGRLFLAGPRAVYRIGELPASAVSARRGVLPPTPAEK
jgi:tetratricopeptide (TPR) repeat protein